MTPLPTGRADLFSVDIIPEYLPDPVRDGAARVVVAAHARDAADLAFLLEALGLDAA